MMKAKTRKKSMSEGHLIRLADFYKMWGVKSTCIAGGGEPLMNPGIPAFLERLKHNGIEAGIITNGSLLTPELSKVIAKTCRWIGISMDAGSAEVYKEVKGINDTGMFARVVGNIGDLTYACEKYKGCDVAYKYLLHPKNHKDIYTAAKLAKDLGCKDFHLRPVGWDNLTVTKGKAPIGKALKSVIGEVELQCSEARALLEGENDDFKFYGVRHKFNPNMTRKVNFRKCWAAPLILTFGADGNCHLCFDMRGNKDLILCKHEPHPARVLLHWGSPRHVKILDDIDVTKCPRCTFGPYNEIVEQVFVEDKMCRYFP
jgi:MoaA/NifB/PqqE/SkfB family radical SAM enzyme